MFEIFTFFLVLEGTAPPAGLRCTLIDAIVQVQGPAAYDRAQVDVGSASSWASTARLGDRIVVEPWLKVGASLETFIPEQDACPGTGFLLARTIDKDAKSPWGKLDIRIALASPGKGRFLLHQVPRPENLRKRWAYAVDPICHYGTFEMIANAWTAKLTSVAFRGNRCSLEGGITWR